jgi:hypothetical protein
MKFYTDQLWQNLNADNAISPAPADAGILATLKVTHPGEWSNADFVVTPAEGAEFNTRLCGEYGQSTSDNSKGIHNPFLCESLLIATISYLTIHYGVTAPSVAPLNPLSAPAGGEFSGSMHISRTPAGR